MIKYEVHDINNNIIMESIDAKFFEQIFPFKERHIKIIKRKIDDSLPRTQHEQMDDVEPRRSKRARTSMSFILDFITFLIEAKPQTYKEVMSTPKAPYWQEAVNDEINSIMQNHTWELVNLPPGNKPIGCKWIFKRKLRTDGTIDKYKARLVAKGYRQNEGLNFFDTCSPVTRITSIRMLIAIVAIHNFEIHQIDVKTAFQNGDLDEEIYME